VTHNTRYFTKLGPLTLTDEFGEWQRGWTRDKVDETKVRDADSRLKLDHDDSL
jgi:hypothetical protein